MEKACTMGKKTIRGFAIFAMVLLFCIILWLFCSGFLFYEDAAFLYEVERPIGLFCLCGVAVFFFVMLYIVSGSLFSGRSRKSLKIIYWGMTACMLLVQCYFLFYVRSYYKWDSGFVIGGAASLTEKGSVAKESFYYLSVYPNQNTFVLITAALVKFGNLLGIDMADRPLLFNLFNTFCMDAALFLVIPIIKKCRKNLADWQLCRLWLFLLLNPFLYLGVSYYYTITLSLPLTQGFLYLMLLIAEEGKKGGRGEREEKRERERGRRTCRRLVSAGILLGVGYELRATAIIFAIAILAAGIWFFAEKGARRGKGILLRILAVLLAGCITAGGLSLAQKSYVGIDTTDTAFPTTHWLMMSLTMPGSHNAEDEAYTASFATREEKKEAVSKRLFEKLYEMSASDYLRLAGTKVKNTFGNGMNGYAVFLADAYRTDGIYEAVFGAHKDFTILWHQGYYLFVMLGILVSLGRFLYMAFVKKETDFYVFALLLVLLGAILFYVLWEASGQYSVPFMFVMILTGLMGYQDLDCRLSQVSHKQKTIFTAAAYLSFAAALFIAFWGVRRYHVMTQSSMPFSHPVAVQILANASYPVDEGETMVQELHLTEPFNHLVIQWRNPAQGESSARYRLVLREKQGKTVFETLIQAAGTGYNGAGIYDFETVTPENEEYELIIEKTGGAPEDDLEFVLYDMYGYQPYPGGELSLCTETDEKKMTSSLLFSVSMEQKTSYVGKKEYVILISLLFLIFLFMGFWCKLRIVSFIGEETK